MQCCNFFAKLFFLSHRRKRKKCIYMLCTYDMIVSCDCRNVSMGPVVELMAYAQYGNCRRLFSIYLQTKESLDGNTALRARPVRRLSRPRHDDRSGRGSVVLLLNSGDPVPLHTWRLPNDTPTCLQLMLDTTNSGGRDGVLCLTRKGELVLLSVASREGDGKVLAPRPQVGECMYVALM